LSTKSTQKEEGQEVLIVDKSQLKTQIKSRIEIGEEITTRKIENKQDYSICWDNFLDWDEFNLELIKQSFDRSNSSYYRDYIRSSGGGGIVSLGPRREPPFQEIVTGLRIEMGYQLKKLQRFYDKIDLLRSTAAAVKADPDRNDMQKLLNILTRFHKIAQELRDRRTDRDPFIIKDEYDVQYLLNALLYVPFDDIRKEDFAPSNSGSNSRIDFVLKSEAIILEVKMTSERLGAKELGGELLIDIGRYKSYPDCPNLVIFIYDKGDYVRNKKGLINDLESQSTPKFKVTVVITPE